MLSELTGRWEVLWGVGLMWTMPTEQVDGREQFTGQLRALRVVPSRRRMASMHPIASEQVNTSRGMVIICYNPFVYHPHLSQANDKKNILVLTVPVIPISPVNHPRCPTHRLSFVSPCPQFHLHTLGDLNPPHPSPSSRIDLLRRLDSLRIILPRLNTRIPRVRLSRAKMKIGRTSERWCGTDVTERYKKKSL
jgi:hypothetical protein